MRHITKTSLTTFVVSLFTLCSIQSVDTVSAEERQTLNDQWKRCLGELQECQERYDRLYQGGKLTHDVLKDKIAQLQNCERERTEHKQSCQYIARPISEYSDRLARQHFPKGRKGTGSDGRTGSDDKSDQAPLSKFPSPSQENAWLNTISMSQDEMLIKLVPNSKDRKELTKIENNKCSGDILCKIDYKQTAISYAIGLK